MIRAALLFAFVAAAACSDLSIPDGATIPCTVDEECPASYVCEGEPGRCVTDADADEAPPGIAGEAAVTPSMGKGGAVFSLSFDVTEPLRAAPVVVVVTPSSGAVPFTADEGATDAAALHYAFTWQATDGPDDGVVLPVQVTLVDRAGNTSPVLSAGTILLDSTKPDLNGGLTFRSGGVDLLGAAIGPYQVVTVSFTTSEALSALPVVSMALDDGTGEAPIAATWEYAGASSSATDYTFQWTVPPGDDSFPDGPHLFFIDMVDLVGNEGSSVPTERLLLDLTPPDVDTGSIDPSVVGDHGVAGVTLVPAEPLSEPPMIVMVAYDGNEEVWPTPAAAGQAWVATLFIDQSALIGAYGDGEYQMFVSDMRDFAGNGSVRIALGPLLVDTLPPTLTIGPPAPATLGAAGGTTSIVVDSPGAASVSAAAVPAAAQPCTRTISLQWSCDVVVDATDLPAGTATAVSIVVQAADAAGNVATGSTAVIVDKGTT